MDNKYYDNRQQQTDREFKDQKTADIIRDPSSVYENNLVGPYTVEDYMKLPEDVRVELIDGYFYDMAPPLQLHQQLLGQLHLQVYNCIEKSSRPCEVYLAPSDVQLDCDI